MEVISMNQTYASGIRRLVAWFLDGLLISAILSMIFHDNFQWGFWQQGDWWSWHQWGASVFSFGLAQNALRYIYNAIMESSKYQATFGKIVLGIKVVGGNGERLSFSRAMLRNVSKLISGLLFGIGYIMIVFDSKKQGLHDKIADTYVVRA